MLDARRRRTQDRRLTTEDGRQKRRKYRISNKEYRMTKGEGRQKTIDSRHKTQDGGRLKLIIGEDISNCRFQILFDGVEKSMNSSKDFP